MTETITPAQALIYAMFTTSAADNSMNDAELRRIGSVVRNLPAFRNYDENDLVALMKLDHRPSQANAQKLALAQQLDRFAKKQENASHTDIPGAIMLASEYLREIGAGSSSILVFSDMQTDLPPGAKRTLEAGELEGTHVAAVNVKRLPADTQDPLVYRSRLARWEREVKHAGASGWRAILDPTRLTPYLAEIRG